VDATKNEQGRKKANEYRYFTRRHDGTAMRAGPCRSVSLQLRFPAILGACLSNGVTR